MFKNSKKNSFYDEMKNSSKINLIEINNVLKIHFIAKTSFNTLSRQKNVKIFVLFMKNLNIQLKKQENKKIIDFKSIIFEKYYNFLNVFSKKKADVLSLHKKYDHRIELEKDKNHEYAFLYNMSDDELLLIKK